MFNRSMFAITALAGAFSAASMAQASTVLYSQQTAAPSYGYFSSTNALFDNTGADNGQRIADNFQINGFGPTVNVGAVSWLGFTADSNADPVFPQSINLVSAFTLSIFADSSGVGSQLFTETFTLAQTNATEHATMSGFWNHSVTLSSTVTLSENTTYWIMIAAVMDEPVNATNWLWVAGAAGGDGTIDSDFNNDGVWEGPLVLSDFHFELLANGVMIPLPGPAALATAGLFGVLGVRRRTVV